MLIRRVGERNSAMRLLWNPAPSPDTVEMDFHQSNANESASVKILAKLVFLRSLMSSAWYSHLQV